MLDPYGIVRSHADSNQFHDARIAKLVSEYKEFLQQIGCAPSRIDTEVARFVRLHG